MQETGAFISARRKGLVAAEFLLLFFLILVVIIAVVNIFTLDSDDGGIPPYRSANAMYVYNALERSRIAVVQYHEMYGMLPGDDGHPRVVDGKVITGNEDGKIDPVAGEDRKVFADMLAAGVLPVKDGVVRIRGVELELLYLRFMAENKVLQQGNYFRLSGMNRLEALAFDRKFDDGNPDSGNVLFFGKGDNVDFYFKLVLHR